MGGKRRRPRRQQAKSTDDRIAPGDLPEDWDAEEPLDQPPSDDAIWDVFNTDEADADTEPQYGDFWLERDDEDE